MYELQNINQNILNDLTTSVYDLIQNIDMLHRASILIY